MDQRTMTDVIVDVLERVAKTYRVKDGVWIDMSKPSITPTPTTPTGKRLLAQLDGRPGYVSLQDVGRIEDEAVKEERQRLRAEHATWDGHATAGFICGICTRLLADTP